MRQNLKIVIKILGDEKEASKIAKNIIKHRELKKITKTSDLVKIIEKSKKKDFSKNKSMYKNFSSFKNFY